MFYNSRVFFLFFLSYVVVFRLMLIFYLKTKKSFPCVLAYGLQPHHEENISAYFSTVGLILE